MFNGSCSLLKSVAYTKKVKVIFTGLALRLIRVTWEYASQG